MAAVLAKMRRLPAVAGRTGPDGPAPPLLEVAGLHRRYGRRVAVHEVSFRLEPGVTGLLGPNGAGKSSVLNCLAGLAAPDSGEVRVADRDGTGYERDIRRRVGFMPERVAFPNEMRVAGYLRHVARAKGVPRGEWTAVVDLALARGDLEGVADRIVGNLSKGYRQRLGLAQALLGDPPVAVLDEPMSGLDPLNVLQARDMLADYASTRAVLLSTHLLADARLMCDRVIVMANGHTVYDGRPAAMADRPGGSARLRIRLRSKVKSASKSASKAASKSSSKAASKAAANSVANSAAGPPAELPERVGGARITERVPVDDGWVVIAEAADDSAGELVRLLAADWDVVRVESVVDDLEAAFRAAVLGSDPSRGNGNGPDSKPNAKPMTKKGRRDALAVQA